MAPTLPDVTTLSSLPESAITAILDLLFEPSADLHALALPTLRSITFTTYPELIDTIRDQLLAISESVHSDPEACQPLLSVLGSHPRLGEKKVESAQSAAEQAQLNKGPKGEAERLAALNTEYEAKFPGLRYVVFVNGRGRDVIMEDMRTRIDRADYMAEQKEAINVSVKTFLDGDLGANESRPWRISQRTGPESWTRTPSLPPSDALPCLKVDESPWRLLAMGDCPSNHSLPTSCTATATRSEVSGSLEKQLSPCCTGEAISGMDEGQRMTDNRRYAPSLTLGHLVSDYSARFHIGVAFARPPLIVPSPLLKVGRSHHGRPRRPQSTFKELVSAAIICNPSGC